MPDGACGVKVQTDIASPCRWKAFSGRGQPPQSVSVAQLSVHAVAVLSVDAQEVPEHSRCVPDTV